MRNDCLGNYQRCVCSVSLYGSSDCIKLQCCVDVTYNHCSQLAIDLYIDIRLDCARVAVILISVLCVAAHLCVRIEVHLDICTVCQGSGHLTSLAGNESMGCVWKRFVLDECHEAVLLGGTKMDILRTVAAKNVSEAPGSTYTSPCHLCIDFSACM